MRNKFFPISGVWAHLKNGLWYESMTDTVWRENDVGLELVG